MIGKQPRFSIITVVYNDIVGLALTQSSIVSQSFSDFEWIVIDGGSSDGTIQHLEQCDIATLLWLSEKDKGIYDAMNKGIKRSTGEYLVFLNAGDSFPQLDTLALVNNALAIAKKPNVLFGGTEYIFPDGRIVFRAPKQLEKCIWHGLPANHQATYYSRKSLNGLLYDLEYKICGDYFLIATLYKMGIKAAYMGVSLVKFSVGGTSYLNRIPLLLEPYVIQRDILGQPLAWRIVSLLKRGISTLGMIVLQNIHRIK